MFVVANYCRPVTGFDSTPKPLADTPQSWLTPVQYTNVNGPRPYRNMTLVLADAEVFADRAAAERGMTEWSGVDRRGLKIETA
jgi:hypothetical protein